ncbi:dehydrogenase/reductase SDR family member 11-like isoform X1 [Haliotis rufescens]|uniref:dehydrogenase/reductase SDR family member 11-like isoform X1 n=1 Tax=Haliotis rufescens TaxID=6454 RepID=UPI00201EC30A|nr:dehydrogenase/reductase SDR family member 11-like isoform X1 [Haliotis rufescens]
MRTPMRAAETSLHKRLGTGCCSRQPSHSDMQRWSGRVALVTGASVGIGAGLVKALVKHGMKVVGCARNVDKIQKLADDLKDEPGMVKAIRRDVSKEEDVMAMFQMIRADPDLGGVDVCINNAGLAHNEPLLTGSTPLWREMVDVNILGLCMCSREAFKSMQERKVDDGHIILLNSLSGHRVMPLRAMHFYSATKFAVTGLCEGLRQELREMKSGIRVTSISPRLVQTDFFSRMYKDEEKSKSGFRHLVQPLQTEDIVSTIVFALQSPEHMEIIDLLVKPTSEAS